MKQLRRLAFGVVSNAVLVAGCSSSTSPTPVPPPMVPDPPKITCPPPQTIQLTTTDMSLPVIYGTATAANGKAPVTTTCAPASGSLFNIGQTTVSCTATDALQRTDTCTLFITVVPPPLLAATSFVAFGDSITRGESGLDSLEGGPLTVSRFRPTILLPSSQWYPTVLQQNLSTRYQTQVVTVSNQGLSGEAVADPGTFPRFTSLLSSRRYGVVLIMEGTNDLFPHDSLAIQPAIDGLRQMLRDAKSRGVRPYLATIPPMNPDGFRGSVYSWYLVPQFNDRVRELAASENVTLVDVYQGLNNNLALIGIDGLHPNADGYARIAELFFTAIKETLEIQASAFRAGAFIGRTR